METFDMGHPTDSQIFKAIESCESEVDRVKQLCVLINEQCKKTQEQLEIMNNQIDRMEGMIDALDNKYG